MLQRLKEYSEGVVVSHEAGMYLLEYGHTLEKERVLFDAILRILDKYEFEKQVREREFTDRLADIFAAGITGIDDEATEQIGRYVSEISSSHTEGHSYRRVGNRLTTLNIANRTVDATVSTESAVPMADYERREMVPEILLAGGVILPESGQVPLLDSHKRQTNDDQLGSVRDLRVEGTEVAGTLHVSSVHPDEWSKIVDGHSTDVSAGYKVLAKTYIPAGRSLSFYGRSYSGPANVVTSWKLFEVSLVPIGADKMAKLRAFVSAAFEDFVEAA